MLKKIFPILFILCLVFSLTFPCFASDGLNDFEVSFFNYGAAKNLVYNGTYMLVASPVIENQPSTYSIFCWTNLTQQDTPYLAIHNLDTNQYTWYYRLYQYGSDNPLLVSIDSGRYRFEFYWHGGTVNDQYYFNILMFDSFSLGLDSKQDVVDFLSRIDYDPSGFYTAGTLTYFPDIDNVNPLSYQFSFFHVFDIANEWNSFVSPIVIFGVVIVSELLFVFIGVFLFKRFRGG